MQQRHAQFRFFEQYKNWDDASPRHKAVYDLVSSLGLLGRWIYGEQLFSILGAYKITERRSGADLIEQERSLCGAKIKSSVVRRLLEARRIPHDRNYAVVCLSPNARTTDAQTVSLEIQMSFGAFGMRHVQDCIKGFRNKILVEVTDPHIVTSMMLDHKGIFEFKECTTRHGNSYWYEVTLEMDSSFSDPVMSTAEAQLIIDVGPIASYKGRVLNAWQPRAIRRTRVELDLQSIARNMEYLKHRIQASSI